MNNAQMLMNTPENGWCCAHCCGGRGSNKKDADAFRRFTKRSERQKWKKEVREQY